MTNGSDSTRRDVLACLVTVGILSAVSGGATMAVLADTGTASDNVVTEGTIDLRFDGGDTFGIGATLEPGQSVQGSVTLTNPATITGSLDVNATYAENDSGTNDVNGTDVARQLRIDALSYGGTDLMGRVGDANPSGWTDLDDLSRQDVTTGERTANDLTDLSDPGDGTEFAVKLTYVDPPDKNYAEDGIDVQFHFDLNQNDQQ